MKNFFAILMPFYFFSTSACTAQPEIKLSKIIFHTTRCMGSCPIIDMQIDSNKAIIVNRSMFPPGKGTPAIESASGMFRGNLSNEKYDSLLMLIKQTNIDAIEFPAVFCCDAPVTTLIVYHDNKRVHLKSMFPPANATALINFLAGIALGNTLKKSNVIDKIEE